MFSVGRERLTSLSLVWGTDLPLIQEGRGPKTWLLFHGLFHPGSPSQAPVGYFRDHFPCVWSHKMTVLLSQTDWMLVWVSRGLCGGELTSGWKRTSLDKVQWWTRKVIGFGQRLRNASILESHSGTTRHSGTTCAWALHPRGTGWYLLSTYFFLSVPSLLPSSTEYCPARKLSLEKSIIFWWKTSRSNSHWTHLVAT